MGDLRVSDQEAINLDVEKYRAALDTEQRDKPAKKKKKRKSKSERKKAKAAKNSATLTFVSEEANANKSDFPPSGRTKETVSGPFSEKSLKDDKNTLAVIAADSKGKPTPRMAAEEVGESPILASKDQKQMSASSFKILKRTENPTSKPLETCLDEPSKVLASLPSNKQDQPLGENVAKHQSKPMLKEESHKSMARSESKEKAKDIPPVEASTKKEKSLKDQRKASSTDEGFSDNSTLEANKINDDVNPASETKKERLAASLSLEGAIGNLSGELPKKQYYSSQTSTKQPTNKTKPGKVQKKEERDAKKGDSESRPTLVVYKSKPHRTLVTQSCGESSQDSKHKMEDKSLSKDCSALSPKAIEFTPSLIATKQSAPHTKSFNLAESKTSKGKPSLERLSNSASESTIVKDLASSINKRALASSYAILSPAATEFTLGVQSTSAPAVSLSPNASEFVYSPSIDSKLDDKKPIVKYTTRKRP